MRRHGPAMVTKKEAQQIQNAVRKRVAAEKPAKTPAVVKYPEHEKMGAKEYEARVVSSFIDFITEQGWEIAAFDDRTERLHTIRQRPDEIIGLFLEIDPRKLEQEKRAILAEIRAQAEGRSDE